MDNPTLVKVKIDTKRIERINWMRERFRSFLPVVVDIETGGCNEKTDALLELSAIVIGVDQNFDLYKEKTIHYHVQPFEGANIDSEALKVNGINPYSALRLALNECEVLNTTFKKIRESLKRYQCTRAILVGHNSSFDLKFINEAIARCKITNNPFHKFSSLDTVTLGALAYKNTVLSRIAEAAGYKWDSNAAHSALYDAQVTANIFCKVFNSYDIPSTRSMLG